MYIMYVILLHDFWLNFVEACHLFAALGRWRDPGNDGLSSSQIWCHRKMRWLRWLYYSGYPTWYYIYMAIYIWHFFYIWQYIYILHVIYLWYIDVGMIISYLIHGYGVRNPVSEPAWVSVIGLYHFLRGIAHLLFVGVNECNTFFFPTSSKLLFVFPREANGKKNGYPNFEQGPYRGYMSRAFVM